MKPGPGKYEFNEDWEESDILYSHSLDGTHENFGESDGFGWYSLILSETFNEQEQAVCKKPAYICREDEHGFFHVVPYDDKQEALAEFEKINEMYRLWEQE